jgi:hypothetical protein
MGGAKLARRLIHANSAYTLHSFGVARKSTGGRLIREPQTLFLNKFDFVEA